MGNAKGQITAPVLVVAAAVGLLYLGGEAIKNHVVLPTVHFMKRVFHKKPAPVPAPIAECGSGMIFDAETGKIVRCLEWVPVVPRRSTRAEYVGDPTGEPGPLGKP